MPDRTQDLKNHRQVTVACKNYTDSEIKKSEERILSIVARNNVDFIDHTNEPTYRFTAPLNSKLLMLQSVAGNSVKYSPSVASDNNATHIKTLPSTVYDLDVSKVEGIGYKVNQILGIYSETYSQNGMSIVASNGSWTLSGTATGGNFNYVRWLSGFNTSHKYLVMISGFSGTLSTKFVQLFSTMLTNNGMIVTPTATGGNIQYYCYDGNGDNKTYYPNIFDLTADFGTGNEPTSISDCATAYLQRGINIYEYTPQQSSIKNNAFTGATIEGTNHFNINSVYSDTTRYTITGDKVLGASPYVFTPTYSKRYFRQDEIGKTFKFRVLFTSNCSGSNLRVVRNVGGTSGDGTLVSTFPNYSYVTITPTSTSDYVSINYSNATTIEIGEVMLSEGNDIVDYEPYTSTTISVDLTTIKDSNNVSLFPSGKLMGNSSVADFITPYNQESRYNEYTFTGNETWSIQSGSAYIYIVGLGGKENSYNCVTNVENVTGKIGTADSNIIVLLLDTSIYDTSAKINDLTRGKTFQYERATYLTSNTDLTSLTKINAQSNGTITLNNTDNVDMPNLISYNAIIKHALATAVKQDGFNIWDEVWEVGGIDNTTGVKENSNARIRSKNYISVMPNTTYYFKSPTTAFIHFYDSNYVHLTNVGTTPPNLIYGNNFTFTTPSNARYILFRMNDAYGTTYNNDICINISGTLNGTYKPYKAPITRLLPNSEAKYSWGITDGVRNTRVFCDDECNPVGKGQIDVGNQDLDSLEYRYNSSAGFMYATISDIKSITSGMPNALITNNYTLVDASALSVASDKTYTTYTAGVYFKDSAYTDTTLFKNHFFDDKLLYQKNATTPETLDDFDFSFDCEEGDTFTIIGCENLQCYATYSFLIKEAKSNE